MAQWQFSGETPEYDFACEASYDIETGVEPSREWEAMSNGPVHVGMREVYRGAESRVIETALQHPVPEASEYCKSFRNVRGPAAMKKPYRGGTGGGIALKNIVLPAE
jgi:hypothetical protein